MNRYQFEKMDQLGEVTHMDEVNADGSPVKTVRYRDSDFKIVYDVDYRNERYKETVEGELFPAEWTEFSGVRKVSSR